MAVGPRDYIDQLLVKKYADEKVDSSEGIKAVDQETMLEAMDDFSNMKRNMIQFKNILHDIKFLKEILKKCQKYQMMNYSKMELTNLQI